jgi:hypothetical protein
MDLISHKANLSLEYFEEVNVSLGDMYGQYESDLVEVQLHYLLKYDIG